MELPFVGSNERGNRRFLAGFESNKPRRDNALQRGTKKVVFFKLNNNNKKCAHIDIGKTFTLSYSIYLSHTLCVYQSLPGLSLSLSLSNFLSLSLSLSISPSLPRLSLSCVLISPQRATPASLCPAPTATLSAPPTSIRTHPTCPPTPLRARCPSANQPPSTASMGLPAKATVKRKTIIITWLLDTYTSVIH